MRASPRPGFGLFQLLVVIAIIALLIGMLLPAVQKVRQSAARMQSSNNLKQLAIGAHNYAATYCAHPPPGIDDKNYSALFHILPYLEQDNLYKSIDKTLDSDDKANAKFRTTIVKTFLSPLDAVNKATPAG